MQKEKNTTATNARAILRFLSTFIIGWTFFLVPIRFHGKLTVPFDVIVTTLRSLAPTLSSVYTYLLILAGAGISLFVFVGPLKRVDNQAGFWREFQTSSTILFFRLAGLLLATLFVLGMIPDALQAAGVDSLIWNTLAISVALIIPIGALVVQLFVSYGGMEFLGTLAEPLMRPLFRLPGRAALDALTSWVGSYSVGLYITRAVYLRGGYTRRQVATLATCFSTVSMGFVGVVAATLNLLDKFPLILLTYFISIILMAMLLVRIPPLCRIPDLTIHNQSEPSPPVQERGSLLQRAWMRALQQASGAPPLPRALGQAFLDGLKLAASILGTIVSVGTLALVVAKFTPLFTYLGYPLVPVIHLLGLGHEVLLASAVLVEITEMYIPALLVVHLPEPARFFIAVMSISQLIFFSSLGPMILDMFREIPIKVQHLLALFLLRTAFLLPFLAAITHLLIALGWLQAG